MRWHDHDDDDQQKSPREEPPGGQLRQRRKGDPKRISTTPLRQRHLPPPQLRNVGHSLGPGGRRLVPRRRLGDIGGRAEHARHPHRGGKLTRIGRAVREERRRRPAGTTVVARARRHESRRRPAGTTVIVRARRQGHGAVRLPDRRATKRKPTSGKSTATEQLK